MSNDLVKRLREAFADFDDLNDAADRIEELEAKLAKAVEAHGKLRSALAEIIEAPGMSPNPIVERMAAIAVETLVEDTIEELTGEKDE